MLLFRYVPEAFGNCPKYITRRRVVNMGQNAAGAGEAQQYGRLSAEDAELLAKTATGNEIKNLVARNWKCIYIYIFFQVLWWPRFTYGFFLCWFIGTSPFGSIFELLPEDMMYLGTGHPEHGADMNIRGGQAGFLQSLVDGQYLAWPDYVGNGFFMSLGNTKLNPQAS